MALETILKERGERYGEFGENSKVSQYIKSMMHAGLKWNELAYDEKECLEMIAAKISRILTGDPHYADNWQDIAGYAQLVADRLKA